MIIAYGGREGLCPWQGREEKEKRGANHLAGERRKGRERCKSILDNIGEGFKRVNREMCVCVCEREAVTKRERVLAHKVFVSVCV